MCTHREANHVLPAPWCGLAERAHEIESFHAPGAELVLCVYSAAGAGLDFHPEDHGGFADRGVGEGVDTHACAEKRAQCGRWGLRASRTPVLMVTAGGRSRQVLLVVTSIVRNRSCLFVASAWPGGLAMADDVGGGEAERRLRTTGYQAASSSALHEFYRQARCMSIAYSTS